MPYYAHTPNASGHWHKLEHHLTETARFAREFAQKFDAGELAYLAGLWHDIGKFNPKFQEYLKQCAETNSTRKLQPSVAHSPVGAFYAWENGFDLIAFLVFGHHAGLLSASALKQRMQKEENDDDAMNALSIAGKNFPSIIPSKKIKQLFPPMVTTRHHTEFLLRMLFSALVDADRLDTEAHVDCEKASARTRKTPITSLWNQFEIHQARLIDSAPYTPLNRARREIYKRCLSIAEQPQGLFRLTVPTGGGKTLSSIGFALKHAIQHNLDRVIVAIPYTSIIEQTADIYRKVFGSASILEHHSAVADEQEEERLDHDSLRMRLAAENWDVPIVVTTNVQLFESLFGNRPGRCRRLHNIARSVLILDEVQTLPIDILEPILDVLQELSDHYGVTIVLCTATQPAFEGESPYLKGLKNVREIVPQPERYFRKLKRVNYEIIREPWTWGHVASEMQKSDQCLTIVNTKKDALALLDALEDPVALHLSTLLCGAHRRDVLAEIRRRLESGTPCRVVSTQVVEAGVDVDFPLVLRAIGPLDRIVQAAGRCNREARLPAGGRVSIFNPEHGSAPRGPYRSAMCEARKILARENADLHNPQEFSEYFRHLYMDVSTDAQGVQESRKNLNFPEVAEKMQLIKNNTLPVIVRYEPHATHIDKLLAQARFGGITNSLWRQLQPYTVNLFENDFRKHYRDGLIEELAPGLSVWCGGYDGIRGIQTLARDPADLII